MDTNGTLDKVVFANAKIKGFAGAAKYLIDTGIMQHCSREYISQLVKGGKLKSEIVYTPGRLYPHHEFDINDLNKVKDIRDIVKQKKENIRLEAVNRRIEKRKQKESIKLWKVADRIQKQQAKIEAYKAKKIAEADLRISQYERKLLTHGKQRTIGMTEEQLKYPAPQPHKALTRDTLPMQRPIIENNDDLFEPLTSEAGNENN